MKFATYNVENMFDRAKALNMATWADGRPALSAHRELNDLFNEPAYGATTKRRLLDLLEKFGLLNKDDGPLLVIRKIRGKLLNRPKSGPVTVIANGRADWIGWAELKTEHVQETATENTARVIHVVGADVLGVVEAEDRPTLRLFNERMLPVVGGAPYDHVMLVDGNDERGIDVGILTRAQYPIISIRSHVDDVDDAGRIFSRDCAEYEIRLPSGATLWVLVNHLKSKGYGSQPANDAKRLRQATRIRAICDAHLAAGHAHVAMIGDFNDSPERPPLAPLLRNNSVFKDVSAHHSFDDRGRPGTHGNCTASSKFDYIFLSPALFAAVAAGHYERGGMWGGKNGTLWPHFPEVQSPEDAASDHAAVCVELNI